MEITYGTKDYNINVTSICFDKLLVNGIIKIPSGDQNRSRYFTDPLDGTLKKVFINYGTESIEYLDTVKIMINVHENTIITQDYDITKIHNMLKIKFGTFMEELPEQKMVYDYLRGNEKVLELGGNIGRNSLVIAHILKKMNNENFVVLESDTDISQQLIENRDMNNFNFSIENSALSKRNLIQHSWNTIVSDELLDGYKNVNIISFQELEKKYNIEFDTLVLDCEGAFYNILIDMPEILDNINLIIMENDYHDFSHKEFIDRVLKEKGFYVDYVEAGGWGPCYDCFFEVWKKKVNL